VDSQASTVWCWNDQSENFCWRSCINGSELQYKQEQASPSQNLSQ
jgi:hypothetical protein